MQQLSIIYCLMFTLLTSKMRSQCVRSSTTVLFAFAAALVIEGPTSAHSLRITSLHMRSIHNNLDLVQPGTFEISGVAVRFRDRWRQIQHTRYVRARVAGQPVCCLSTRLPARTALERVFEGSAFVSVSS